MNTIFATTIDNVGYRLEVDHHGHLHFLKLTSKDQDWKRLRIYNYADIMHYFYQLGRRDQLKELVKEQRTTTMKEESESIRRMFPNPPEWEDHDCSEFDLY